MAEKELSLAERRCIKPGILRLDLNKPRKTSTISFEGSNLAPHAEVEPMSPQPSVDRLSVTFAGEEKSPDPNEKVRFNENQDDKTPIDIENEDDYSATFNAILTRQGSRGSRKRKSSKRRGSSPYSPDSEYTQNLRRRSSVFTTSSGDTAISMDETTQEQIFQKMRVHKEVLSQVKHQPWPIHRKLKLVQTARAYIKRHEGALHERLAHNKSTKDVLAHFNIKIVDQWHHLKRELINFSKFLIPWESRIKEIESHFGSVVASYFTFLRWLFSVNLVTAVVLVTFVALPEAFMASKEDKGERKGLLPSEEKKSQNLMTLWNFEGILKYSPLFYGYYNTQGSNGFSFWYKLPHAYFMTGLGVYIYSFVAILRKMAENSRQSKLSEKDDECVFTWKIFTGWDYMIGNAETAHNRTASIILGFKEALLEEEEKKRDEGRNWKMTSLRIFTHLMVLGLIFTSVYVVIWVVQRSTEVNVRSSWWRQSEVTNVVTLIGFIYPMLFDLIGMLESYHPRKALRVQLARIMVLNLLNLYSFIFATFSKINDMSIELRDLAARFNSSNSTLKTPPNPFIVNHTKMLYTTTTTTESSIFCDQVEVDCPVSSQAKVITIALLLNSTYTTSSTFDINQGFLNKTTPIMDYDYDYNGTNWSNLIPEVNDSYVNFTEEINDFIPFNITPTSYIATETTIMDNLDINMTESNISGKKCYIQKCVDLLNVTDNFLNLTTEGNLNSSVTYTQSPLVTSEPDAPNPNRSLSTKELSLDVRKKLRSLCWETMFGQELVKLTIMDLVITVASILLMDFFRAIFVRVMNNCWCWDLEKRFPQYGDFKIAENILHLVNNQGMVWMGMFFSPGLPLINLLKLVIVMYMRSWAVLTCNVPHEVVFKASRSNNFYFALLLTMLFLCVLPVGYAIVWVEPSWHCGPFSNHTKIYHIFTSTLKRLIPTYLHKVLDYIASPGIVIPLLMLLILIIYYLISLTNALREANDDLKIQLRRERTEERRKVFQLAQKKRRGTDTETPFNKWRKILNSVPEGPKSPIDLSEIRIDEQSDLNKKEIMNNLLNSKSSSVSDEGIPQLEKDSEKSSKKGIHNIIKTVLKSKKTRDKKRESKDSKVFREREDSTTSAWSADIPEIKIIETDSNENTLENSPDPAKHSMSSSDTIIAIENNIDGNKEKRERKRGQLSRGKINQEDEESLGIGESYESIADCIRKMHDLTNKNEESAKIKARKAIASVLFNEAQRRRMKNSNE